VTCGFGQEKTSGLSANAWANPRLGLPLWSLDVGRSDLASYAELREKHSAETVAALPDYTERLSWSADLLRDEREEGLRRLVRLAKERSPWHQARLIDVDPETLTEGDLHRIPPMTKDDLMASWDQVVTDGRLRLDRVNSHLDSLKTDAYLFVCYHAVASGGSTGRRGVFVYDWTSWSLYYIMMARWAVRRMSNDPEHTDAPLVLAVLGAERATHVSSALNQTFANALATVHRFPITRPIAEIVDGLNSLQPTYVSGYPSALYLLSHEARAGRLRISPRHIGSSAEPLLPKCGSVTKMNYRNDNPRSLRVEQTNTLGLFQNAVGVDLQLRSHGLVPQGIQEDSQAFSAGQFHRRDQVGVTCN